MRRLWLLFAATTILGAFGSAPTAAAEGCLHGIYIDLTDFKPYACPWGGGILHTAHGDVYVDSGGIVLPDSAYAYGLPDDGSDDDEDGGPDAGAPADDE